MFSVTSPNRVISLERAPPPRRREITSPLRGAGRGQRSAALEAGACLPFCWSRRSQAGAAGSSLRPRAFRTSQQSDSSSRKLWFGQVFFLNFFAQNIESRAVSAGGLPSSRPSGGRWLLDCASGWAGKVSVGSACALESLPTQTYPWTSVASRARM